MKKEQKEKLKLCRSIEEQFLKLQYIHNHPKRTDEILNIIYREEEFKELMDIDYEEWLIGPFPIFLDCAVEGDK